MPFFQHVYYIKQEKSLEKNTLTTNSLTEKRLFNDFELGNKLSSIRSYALINNIDAFLLNMGKDVFQVERESYMLLPNDWLKSNFFFLFVYQGMGLRSYKCFIEEWFIQHKTLLRLIKNSTLIFGNFPFLGIFTLKYLKIMDWQNRPLKFRRRIAIILIQCQSCRPLGAQLHSGLFNELSSDPAEIRSYPYYPIQLKRLNIRGLIGSKTSHFDAQLPPILLVLNKIHDFFPNRKVASLRILTDGSRFFIFVGVSIALAFQSISNPRFLRGGSN